MLRRVPSCCKGILRRRLGGCTGSLCLVGTFFLVLPVFFLQMPPLVLLDSLRRKLLLQFLLKFFQLLFLATGLFLVPRMFFLPLDLLFFSGSAFLCIFLLVVDPLVVLALDEVLWN